jgi:hypothetical protein
MRRGLSPARFVIASAVAVSIAMAVACGSDNDNNGGGGGGLPPSSNPAISSLTLNPASVVGGAGALGTVTLNGAPSVGASVVLSSSSPTATVPGSVTVNSGTTTATFDIATSAVQANTGVTIAGTLNGTRSATLTLTPAPPPAFAAQMRVTSLTDALRKTNGSQTTPVPGRGAGTLDTCPLVNTSGTPQLSCEFDGGPSTSSNTIVSYRWTWKLGSKQDSQNNSEPKFQPKVSDCGFFGGQSDGGLQLLNMVVTLEITDSTGAKTSVTNPNVSVFPAGLCGYAF